ncbi:dihydroorotase [Govanella unica]|uniref:Dihydroorotase n=1 Tax=Govanella unica TaxID=2975056 RepID=A0A9X3TWD0_9PROT|nr:dihydroorotase [Govania unica]MDA5193161.1 dihydroorotase [Govania unica]
MSQSFDLLIRSGTVVNHAGTAVADIGVTGGRIAAIGDLAQASAGEVIDARGLHILPGVIDTQVHFREPGLEHKEDLATGAAGAVMGGVTAVFEMPNTKPATTTAEAILDKLARAKNRMWCDHAFYVGATAGNVAELAEIERLPGCAGVKVFMGSSTGDLLVWDDATLLQVLKSGRRRVAIHAEDEERLKERKHIADGGNVADHPNWRDVETAFRATSRVLKLAREAERLVHVLHVTTGEEMTLLGQNKDIASVETTPQHLTLAAPDCYLKLGSYAQMNPPIREAHHRDALWRAIANGIVDVIGSDHAPHTREEKAQAYPASPSGMTGVQTLLPLLLDHVNAGRLTLERLVDLTSAGAQRLFGLRDKGRLAVGWHADFSIVDLKKRWTITHDWIESRSGWTPFDGVEITGKPVGTIIRGRRVMWQDELIGTAHGAPIRFETVQDLSK